MGFVLQRCFLGLMPEERRFCVWKKRTKCGVFQFQKEVQINMLGKEKEALPAEGALYTKNAPSAVLNTCNYPCAACTAVIATTLTISSTEQPRERSLTGLARPWMIGPTASASATRSTSL